VSNWNRSTVATAGKKKVFDASLGGINKEFIGYEQRIFIFAKFKVALSLIN
jgi:hypothetical protein